MRLGSPGAFVAPGAAYDARVPMQVPKNVIRINEQAIWSARQYLNAANLAGTREAVFQVGQGSIGQGFARQLSIAETSQTENSRISNARSFLVDAIAIHPYYEGGDDATAIFPVAEGDLLNYQAHCVPAWGFLQTVIEIGTGVLIGAGGGVFGSTADTAGAYGASGSQVALNNGAGQCWIYRKNPVMLPGGTVFNMLYLWGLGAVAVDGGSNSSNLILKTLLLGKYETAVPQG
jgi:hypothetical protein